ncbi:MAG: hypothetical protein ABJE79_08670 [Marinomonas sp.]
MILLISDTPVAGTVDRLATWIKELSGTETVALVKRNYPHHAFELQGGVFGCLPNWESYVLQLVKKASLVILHNVLDEKVINIVFREKKKNVNVIYQLHSPPLEGPQFSYNIFTKYKFDAILSVNQGHGRFIENSIPVPNIVEDFELFMPPEKQDLVFVPHIRSTNFRWSNKFSPENANQLNTSKNLFGKFKVVTIKDLFGRDVVSHSEIQFVLQFCKFIVDDLNTGLMHQTAIEGLKSGCGVFSGADLYTVEEYSKSIEAPPPPLIYVDGIQDVVKFLVRGRCDDFLIENQAEIKKYSRKYLGEERLARIYFDTIKRFLN